MKNQAIVPLHERPRERLLAHGPSALTSPELLAIILRTGIPGCDAVALGHALMQQFNGLRGLLSADAGSLMRTRGLGKAKTCELLAVSELARRSLGEALANGHCLDQPGKVKQFCAAHLAHLKVEHCMALFLDSQHRLICHETLSRGTLSQASVYPREVVKAALAHHAAAVTLSHNHPSGVRDPSHADLALTRHLRNALQLIDVRLLDHMIVTPDTVTSLAERGDMA